MNRNGLQETYLWEISGLNGSKEVIDVIVVIGGIAGMTNRCDRLGTGMSGIRGGCVVLERSVMWNVIRLRTNDRRGRLAVASGAAVGIYLGQVEASAEPTPGDTGCVEQVADISSLHLCLGSAAGANII